MAVSLCGQGMLLQLSVLLFAASQRNWVTFTCENEVCDMVGQSEVHFRVAPWFGSLCLRNDPGIQLLQRDFTRRAPWKASAVQHLERESPFPFPGDNLCCVLGTLC